ncbi:hypothetical protein BGW80DRAFT_1461998 [Lactifluus volemus]|nr:hypothetical protein BGW80DRAFT_1461998 [Lactifluus volemus]
MEWSRSTLRLFEHQRLCRRRSLQTQMEKQVSAHQVTGHNSIRIYCPSSSKRGAIVGDGRPRRRRRRCRLTITTGTILPSGPPSSQDAVVDGPHSIHGSGSRTPREQSTSSREVPPLPAGAESGSTTLLSASLANGVLSSSTTAAAQENGQQQQQ